MTTIFIRFLPLYMVGFFMDEIYAAMQIANSELSGGKLSLALQDLSSSNLSLKAECYCFSMQVVINLRFHPNPKKKHLAQIRLVVSKKT